MVASSVAKSRFLESMRWRCIGPHRGGRVVAVAGDPLEPMTFYFGACGGGVWKTEDGGVYWQNVSDGHFASAAVGAIAVADSDTNVIYAGTGEACIRGNVSSGDGVYKSTDAGKTWNNMGLKDTRHIGRIRVHPLDPNLVYVAALGHAFGSNRERGVYRSKDGGENWEQVLFRSDKAGAVDLSIDSNNPRVIYAAVWQALREPWTFTSGGPDSGLFKSVDAGDTWTEITNNPGIPKGTKGRIGVAVSPAKSGRVWAVVEAKEGGLFRSDDGGSSWEAVSYDRNLLQRPWYYSHVFADPTDAETVWVLCLKTWKSTDGGQNFSQITMPHGDNHDLWIDPQNSRRMIEGNDGGACVTFNGGETWSTIYNQPTSQFYHMTTDNQFPYRVYATQQDNSAISVPSRSTKGAILWGDCYSVGSSESGHIAVRPDDPNIVYSGAIGSSPGGGDSLLRYDHSTGQTRTVSIWPELVWGWGLKDHKYRFQWTYPIVISPHNPDVLYAAANVLFRSIDEGSSWEAISPDLTRNDTSKMEAAGGPITLDTTAVEHYGTIFALTESSHEEGVFWVGSDDGLVHISRDGGDTWDDVTPRELPKWARIDVIEVSHHDPATAYMSATLYKFDDDRPFLYRTDDYGKSWVKIINGIPEDEFTRVVREDVCQRGLLYSGTDRGVYLSFDRGDSWHPLNLNLPTVPVTDLAVKENELVASTNGRSFWILDDLPLIRQVGEKIPTDSFWLFEPTPTYRIAPLMGADRAKAKGPGKNYVLALGYSATYYEENLSNGETVRTMLDAGTNPPDGVVVNYFLDERSGGDATMTFLDSEGRLINTFSSETNEDDRKQNGDMDQLVVAVEPGMNRFVWDMRSVSAPNIKGEGASGKGVPGPISPPGRYQVRLTVGGHSQIQNFELLKDPRVKATQTDLEKQHSLLMRISGKLAEANEAVNRSRNIRRQVDGWIGRASGTDKPDVLSDMGDRLTEKLRDIEDELVNAEVKGDLDRISKQARLSAKLGELITVPASADFAPTQQAYDVFEDLSERTDSQLIRLQEVIDTDLPKFVDLIHELEIPVIAPQSPL